MQPDAELAATCISLLERAELSYPYVSLRRLRALARAAAPDASRGLAGWLRESEASGIVFADARLRVRRDGEVVPEYVYRLNRTHPTVLAALDGQPTVGTANPARPKLVDKRNARFCGSC